MTSCSSFGTQCLDTGAQLQASNIAYDNTVTGGDCAHVQCYLEYLGTNQDGLRQDLDAHAGNAGNPHSTSFDNLIDTAVVSPIDGQVATLQGGVWVNENPVTGVTDHLLLTNIGTNSHEIIDEHLANLSNPHMVTAAQAGAEPANPNIQGHIVDTDNPHDTKVTGYNVLINGDFRINQRGFNGNWQDGLTALGEFGYDRWYKLGTGTLGQRVETANMMDGETYTVSTDPAVSNTVTVADFDNNTIVSGFAPQSFVYNALAHGNIRVSCNDTAPRIKLEMGSVATIHEPRSMAEELALCQRYYQLLSHGPSLVAHAIGDWDFSSLPLPVHMRVVPSVNYSTDPSNSGTWADVTMSATTSIVRLAGNITADATGFSRYETINLTFNAEIT